MMMTRDGTRDVEGSRAMSDQGWSITGPGAMPGRERRFRGEEEGDMTAQKTRLDASEAPVRLEKPRRSRTVALDDEARGHIYRQWRCGVSAEVLAEQVGRSTATIVHAI